MLKSHVVIIYLIGLSSICTAQNASADKTSTITNCHFEYTQIVFRGKSTRIPDTSKVRLQQVAKFLKANPGCKLSIGACCDGEVSWKRLTSVMGYIKDAGDISDDRFQFAFDIAAANSVAFEGTGDEPEIPAPHPNLKTELK